MGKLLDKYKEWTPPETLESIRELADHLQGSSLLHVHSARLPMAIKSMLGRLSELFADVGIRHWSTVLVGTEEYFDMVRFAEHGLGEASDGIVPKALRAIYSRSMKENSRQSYLSANVVVVHGLQPLGLVEHRPDHRPWIWRCHSDLCNAAPGFLSFAQQFASRYQGALFSHEKFIPEVDIPTFIVPPSVDPFGEMNRPMTRSETESVLKNLGVPSDRLLVLQFLSEGTAAEALEAIRVWRGVAASQEAVLVLVQMGPAVPEEGRQAPISPRKSYEEDGVCLVSLGATSEQELCALGWAATVVVDSSTSSWPNINLLNVLWKSKPILVAEGSRSACLIPEEAGGRFKSPAELAWRLTELLRDLKCAQVKGRAAKTIVRERYLAPRHLLDYLNLLHFFEEESGG